MKPSRCYQVYMHACCVFKYKRNPFCFFAYLEINIFIELANKKKWFFSLMTMLQFIISFPM